MTALQKIEFAALAAAAAALLVLTIILALRLRRERKKAEKRIKVLEHEVRYDYLTGALSRKAFTEELEASLAVDPNGTFLIFDINSFKAVNDMYGHKAGDGLIKRYAAKLLKAFGSEYVGRLGGDEFLVFIPRVCEREDLNERLKKSGVFRFDDKTTKLRITSCCGVAFAPENGSNFDDLYRKADHALYHSKKNDSTISYCN